MKPIPPGYCEAADNAPIPGRPWWTTEGPFGGARVATTFVRCDGVKLTLARWLGVFPDADAVPVPDDDPTGLATCAAYDAAHSLPHPGYRAGQVWLHPCGTTFTVALHERDVVYVVDTQFDSDGILVPFVRRIDLSDCLLLHDPLMPSRAPWSPK